MKTIPEKQKGTILPALLTNLAVHFKNSEYISHNKR